ncbi:MAG TPA: hypothetical protein VJZ49_12735 [Syntrophales bacterium]|nr:hypothetical protein [Syntrophales bacterium]
MKKRLLLSTIAVLCALSLSIITASAWHDETHLAIAKAAGYPKWYNAAGPDIAKIKAGFTEGRNHYSDNNGVGKVTPEMVLAQVNRYNDPDDNGGHLYGAIIASLRTYTTVQKEGKYAQYHLAYCAHYLGDLSQPQHNSLFDEFNKIHHDANDGVVENKVLKKINKIEKHMYPINLRLNYFESDLAAEITRIANIARDLDSKLRKENRNMSQEEAYRQLGHSASLLKAILNLVINPNLI